MRVYVCGSQEVNVVSPVLTMQVFNEKLCVGYESGFSLFHLYTDESPLSKHGNHVYALSVLFHAFPSTPFPPHMIRAGQ